MGTERHRRAYYLFISCQSVVHSCRGANGLLPPPPFHGLEQPADPSNRPFPREKRRLKEAAEVHGEYEMQIRALHQSLTVSGPIMQPKII